MRRPTSTHHLTGIVLFTALAAPALAGPTLLNDPFNDGNPATNAGPGAVNPAGSGTQPWFATSGGFSGHTANYAEANGVLTLSGTANTTPYALAQVNGRGQATYGFYNTTGDTFRYTLGGMTVANANTEARTDIPGSGLGAIRYELGVISNRDTNTDAVDELYRTSAGGLFVSVYKDAAGNLTGSLRETNDQKGKGYDSEGLAGIKTLATFALPGFDGVADFNVDLTLSSTGYALSFDKTVVVTSGTLAGGYGLRSDGVTPWFSAASFDTGAFATVSGQMWGNITGNAMNFGAGGYGSMNVGNVAVFETPEPSTLLAGTAVAAGLLRRRRA